MINRKSILPPLASDRKAMVLREVTSFLAVIGLLVLVQLSTLAGGSRSTEAEVCRSNHRKLIQAWLMYTDDNAGNLVPNSAFGGPSQPSWVAGWLDFTSSLDNVNTNYLVSSDLNGNYGLLGPYLQRNPAYFHCPSDASSVILFGRYQRRVRSVSMNEWMAGSAWNGFTEYKVYKALSDISDPSGKFVTIDERPDSINDCWLAIDMGGRQMVDFPGSYHSGGTWLSFADGHVEFRRWVDPQTTPAYSQNQLLVLGNFPANTPDANWLLERTSELK